MSFDKHIPAPRVTHPEFRRMEIGDSVFVPHEGSILKCSAYMYAATIQKRAKSEYRFVGRSVVERGVPGVRIWRLAV